MRRARHLRSISTALGAALVLTLGPLSAASASPGGGDGFGAGVGAGPGGNVKDILYSSIPAPLPPNFPSQPFEAQQVSEVGDGVVFAAKTGRVVKSVTVTMSSWACQSGAWYDGTCTTTPGATFTHPLTLSIYAANGSTVLARSTQTFALPYRPSSDPGHCGDTRWYDASTQKCSNGKAANVVFSFPSGVTVPDSVVWGIAYNTTHYGYSPIGESAACFTTTAGCPYDSLNVALTPSVLVGAQATPGGAWLSSLYAGFYGDGGAGGTGTFRLDPTGWTGYVPAVQFSKAAVR